MSQQFLHATAHTHMHTHTHTHTHTCPERGEDTRPPNPLELFPGELGAPRPSKPVPAKGEVVSPVSPGELPKPRAETSS